METNSSNNVMEPVHSGSNNFGVDKLFRVEEFCQKHGGKSKGILITYAPEVYVIAKFGGIERARIYFSEKLGRRISKHPVEALMKKIREGKVVITEKEIWKEASRHRDTTEFFVRTPAALNPRDEDMEEDDREEGKAGGKEEGGTASAAPQATQTPRAQVAPRTTPTPPRSPNPKKVDEVDEVDQSEADQPAANRPVPNRAIEGAPIVNFKQDPKILEKIGQLAGKFEADRKKIFDRSAGKRS